MLIAMMSNSYQIIFENNPQEICLCLLPNRLAYLKCISHAKTTWTPEVLVLFQYAQIAAQIKQPLSSIFSNFETSSFNLTMKSLDHPKTNGR